MLDGFKELAVLRKGDASGNRMVLRLTTHRGTNIHAIGVPQDWPSRTGPTWTYLFENDGLTLVDAGAVGSFRALTEGIAQAGFQVQDIDRVIITHGHADHDGAAAQLADEAGAEVWAHEIYAHLLDYDPWEIYRPASPVQAWLDAVVKSEPESGRSADNRRRHESYLRARERLEVTHTIRAEDRSGGLTFIHAPGHSPDELCVTLDEVVFTGDHVLPEITPHPTTKVRLPLEVKRNLPPEYHDEDKFYGLATYLRTLKGIVDLGPGVKVLPAHRLFNKNRFNFQGVRRAGEIIEHHALRLRRIMLEIGPQPTDLEAVTRGIFQGRKLVGSNLYMALLEVVAHVEFLQDTGDLEMTEGRVLQRTGSENYRQRIAELTS